ncbi:MAG TPA: hypothetical protein VHZ07_15855 [Bryobacteraceae bacterium]|jgi:hypothetical protein|nr:hypothetical protein [Bryobacteraceae bacterium]
MKNDQRQSGSITKPLLKDLMDRQKANENCNPEPYVGSTPLQPPALYEDAGEGYNLDYTFPQE